MKLKDILQFYTENYPAFRSMPVGAPNSSARELQKVHIAVEDAALDFMEDLA